MKCSHQEILGDGYCPDCERWIKLGETTMSKISKTCTTHYMCNCIHERLDRIEAVWQEHKHLDYLLTDKAWLGGDTSLNNILYDLWQAIRREE